ncbi:MAG: hypothetical protein LUC39_02930 [Clostridiales bacterium]|nr:hypothetical protein [Clostridiales bacterium]
MAYQVTNRYITEGGCELVLVSAHLGARTRGENQPELAGHDRWQGRAYRIRGSEPGYPNLLETTGYDIDPETGEGRVVNPLGLHGYNCRHSHKPWDRRLRNPYLDENGDLTIDTEENRQRYRLEQRQRAMERAIRQTRRQLQVKALELEADPENADLQAEYSALENRLSRQDEAYNRFCQENGLAAQYERLRVTDGDGQGKQVREQGKRTEQERSAIISPSIKTAEYRRKIDQLGENVETSRTIWQQATQMLNHRSGTLYEDLAFIDSTTGETLVQDAYNVERACMPTKRMKSMLLNSEPNTVIAVHNHPGSSVPSVEDLKAALSGKYKYGVVVCHNGVIFKYSVRNKFDADLANIFLDSLQDALYNGNGTIADAIEKIEYLGISMEVIS